MKSTSGMFLSPAGDAGGGTKLAKTMLVDTQISKLTRDVEKLMGIAAQHGAKIKELMVTAANSVSQVEFMSAITTTRFQNLNIVKSIHKPEEKEADENSVSSAPVTNAKRGTVVNDDKDGTDVKQLKALVSHLENELHQFDFKNGMENKKIENEMKISRKEFYELKNHITSLEKKLEDFAHAVEKGGISTNVQFVDPNQKAPPPPRKSSFLGDFSVTEINQQHQQNLATKAQQLCIEEEASEITWKDDNGSNAEEGDSDISFEETATMNDQENIIETSKHNEPEKRRQSIAKAKEIVHEEPETVLQPVVEHVVRHPTQVHTQHQVPSVIQAKQEAVIQSQPLDSTTKPVQHETRRQSVMKETTAHNNHQTTSIPANPDPQTISPIKETQPTISIPAETKQINITHEPNLVSVTSRVERRKSTVPVANQPEVEITIPANSTSRRMSVQKSKPNRQTIASKKKEVELVFDDDLPDKEDEFFQVENRRLVQAAFHSQSSPLKREDIFNDYREQSRLLFTKIVAIKQVEDLSRVVTNESVTNALNAAENKLFGKFQEEIFDRLGRSSTVSIGAQTLESGPTHTQKMQAINNVAAVMNNGGSNSSGTNVARTTQRVSRINRSNTINHNKNVPADKDLPELANTNQISKQKRNSVAEKSPTKESESLHNFNLSNIGEDEDIHPAAILETDSTDNAEADVTGNHRPQTTAKTSRKLPSAGNTRTKNGQIVIPDVIMRDSLPSEAEDSVFESLSNLDPLFIQDLSASFSVDLAPAPMGDVRKWVDKKFTKLVELMNERFQAIDDHNKHISDNCNRLLQETNRLHQEMFLLSKNMEKLNESNKILSKRVKETMENISDNLDPLTAATTQSQENIVEMEKMLVTVVEDLDKFKKDQGKQHNEITKV